MYAFKSLSSVSVAPRNALLKLTPLARPSTSSYADEANKKKDESVAKSAPKKEEKPVQGKEDKLKSDKAAQDTYKKLSERLEKASEKSDKDKKPKKEKEKGFIRKSYESLKSSVTSPYTNWKSGPRNIPGIPIYPLVGSYPSLWTNSEWDTSKLHFFYDRCFEKYGDIFKMGHPGGGRQIFIRDASDVQTVLMNRPIMMLPKRRHFDVVAHIRGRSMKKFFKRDGIAFGTGNEWLRVRRQFDDLFLKTPLVKEANLIDEVTREFMVRIKDNRDQESCQIRPGFLTELKRWSTESLSNSLMGARIDDLKGDISEKPELQDLIKHSDSSVKLMNAIEFSPQTWRIYRNKTYKALEKNLVCVQTYLYDRMHQRHVDFRSDLANSKGTIMEILLAKTDSSEEDIYGNMHDFLGAGMDVTPRQASQLVYALARHPEAQRKVRHEVLSVVGTNPNTPMTLDTYNKMPYLKAFVKETMRLYPTVNTTNRKVVEPLKLRGYRIPANYSVTLPLHALGQYENNVCKAKEFIPERFIGRNNPLCPKPFSFLPYSFGLRQCIARNMADILMRNLTARVVQRYHVDIPSARSTYTCITIHLDEPLDFFFKEIEKCEPKLLTLDPAASASSE